MKTEIEQIHLQFAKRELEKKASTSDDFEPPRRECQFCGRVTNHSANGKVCLVCGLINDGH